MRCSENPWLSEGLAIAAKIRAAAVRARDGTVTWCFLLKKERGGRRRIFLSPHFYAGVTGVALFMAAAERVRGRGDDAELCLAALAPLRREAERVLSDPARFDNVRHGIGGLCGLGSFIYAFLKIAELLGEPDLVTDAHRLSALMTPDRIACDEHLDVMSGSAGAILALLALHRVAPEKNALEKTPLELAEACGRVLLDRRRRYRGSPRVWPRSDRPAIGFAHGTAGICSALLRLYEGTGRQELWEAAREGLAYQSSRFIPERGNWRIDTVPESRFLDSWCNGSTGIVLGHLSTLHVPGNAEVHAEMRQGLATVASAPLAHGDFLCCGNFGRVDVLLEAHAKLGEPELVEAAEHLASRALERAKAQGGFVLMPEDHIVFDPRLFVGLTGIGYALLRLGRPESIPSFLAME